MKILKTDIGYYVNITNNINDIVIFKEAYFPDNIDTSNYKLVGEEEANEIKLKQNIYNKFNNTPNEFINALIILPQVINELNLTDEQAIKLTNYYPEWITFIGKPLLAGTKTKHNNVLYEANVSIDCVDINDSPDKYIINNQPSTMFRSASIKQPKYKLVTK